MVPLTLAEANRLVARWHRHHQPVRGHRFSIGAIGDNGETLGAAIVGRPVARLGGKPSEVCEVTRLVTNGEKNCCSFLYGATARIAKAMGFRRIQTYILATEPGTSLKAAGWTYEGETAGGQWEHSSERQLRLDGGTRRRDQPTSRKIKWSKTLSGEVQA